MSGFTGVTINKLNGGLGRQNSTGDDVMALVVGCDVSGIAATADTAYKCIQLKDAEDIGFTAAYDANEENLVNHHVAEFFRLAPNGTLYLIPVAEGQTQQAMFSTTVQALLRANSDIKVLAFANGSYANGTTEAAVQTIVDSLRSEFLFIDAVLLEGTGSAFETTGVDNAISAYPDLRTLACPNVSVVIAQDPVQDTVMGTTDNHFAAMGAVLGMLAARNVAENLGSVDIENKPNYAKGQNDFPLTQVSPVRFETAKLSNGQDVSSLTQAEIASLTAKGYIFAASYLSYSGVFFNNSPTCVEAASDYAYIENNRIWNKAARGIRTALLPRVGSRLETDATSGFLLNSTAAFLENKAGEPLETMKSSGEITDYDVYVNPEQTPDASTALVVKAKVAINRIVHEFTVDVGIAYSL